MTWMFYRNKHFRELVNSSLELMHWTDGQKSLNCLIHYCQLLFDNSLLSGWNVNDMDHDFFLSMQFCNFAKFLLNSLVTNWSLSNWSSSHEQVIFSLKQPASNGFFSYKSYSVNKKIKGLRIPYQLTCSKLVHTYILQ